MMHIRLTWRKVIISLVVVLAFLQLLHLSLLTKLEAKYEKIMSRKLNGNQVNENAEQMRDKMQRALDASHVVDGSGEYKIVNNFIQDVGFERNTVFSALRDTRPGVTIVTQCSVNNLHHLVTLHTNWEGRISLAVFTPGNHILIAAEILLKMYQCYPSMSGKISVHLVYPLSRVQRHIHNDDSALQDVECHNLQDFIRSITKDSTQNYATVGVKYPNNLLRNVALRNVRTEYVFVIDIDMLPSGNLHKQFTDLSHSKTVKLSDTLVYVVPAFEIRTGKSIPRVKSELISMWNKDEIRPFYYEMCWKCQNVTNYDRWKLLSRTDNLEIGYEIEWKDPWEPFFITHKEMVFYDERFKQYGFNRISQVIYHTATYNLS